MPNTNNRLITFYIYEITNNINGKTYIGQRKCPINKTPWTDTRYMGSGKKLRIAKKKYGLNNFSKKILAICYSQNILDVLEIQYISMYKEIGKAEYNTAGGGQTLCRKYMTKEEIEKLNKIRREYWNTEEGLKQRKINSLKQKNNKNAWTKGKHWYNNGTVQVCTKECPEGFVPGQLFRPCSEERKKKTSETFKNMSPERKEQWSKHLSEARMGKKLSDSCRANISKANKGRKYYNNGEIEVMRFECPPGFVPGRCPKNK